MTTLIVSIVVLSLAALIFSYRCSRNNYRGFANTTLKRILRGEMSSKDIQEMKESIALDAKNKSPKSTGFIPLK